MSDPRISAELRGLAASLQVAGDACYRLADLFAPDPEPEPDPKPLDEWTLSHTVAFDEPLKSVVVDLVPRSTALQIDLTFTPGPGPMPGSRGELCWFASYDPVRERGINRDLLGLILWTDHSIRFRAGIDVPHSGKATLDIPYIVTARQPVNVSMSIFLGVGLFTGSVAANGTTERVFPSGGPMSGPFLFQVGGENPWPGSEISATLRLLD